MSKMGEIQPVAFKAALGMRPSQPNPKLHWFNGITWLMLHIIQVRLQLEVFSGKGICFLLSQVKPRPSLWSLSDLCQISESPPSFSEDSMF